MLHCESVGFPVLETEESDNAICVLRGRERFVDFWFGCEEFGGGKVYEYLGGALVAVAEGGGEVCPDRFRGWEGNSYVGCFGEGIKGAAAKGRVRGARSTACEFHICLTVPGASTRHEK